MRTTLTAVVIAGSMLLTQSPAFAQSTTTSAPAEKAPAPAEKAPVRGKSEASVTKIRGTVAGVDKDAFLAGVRADPQTYGDWSAGEWEIETDGKEDALYSPFLRKPFARAIADGVMPADLTTIAGTWGAVHDTGELTYMNLVHLAGCDGTDPDSLTRFEIEGRRQVMHAIEALRRYTPGCEGVRLRNLGMTIGIRDTRKIEALYDMTGEDVREQGRFEDSIGIFPEFIDGYGVLILPTTGRYFQVPYRSLVPKGIGNLIVAGRSIGGDKISHASVRNMMCCTVSGQGAGVAAAVSVRDDTPFDALDVGKIQTELKRQGVRLD